MDKFRDEALKGMQGLKRVPHTGNKWIVTLPKKFGGEKAVFKTGKDGTMMTTAESGDPDALLIGMERGIDSSITKILAVMKTDDGVTRYYLLDRMMVVNRLKENHRIWIKRKDDYNENTTRVLSFRDYKIPKLDPQFIVFDEWEKYVIHSVKFNTDDDEYETPADIVEAAKNMVANAYDISANCVDINVRLTL